MVYLIDNYPLYIHLNASILNLWCATLHTAAWWNVIRMGWQVVISFGSYVITQCMFHLLKVHFIAEDQWHFVWKPLLERSLLDLNTILRASLLGWKMSRFLGLLRFIFSRIFFLLPFADVMLKPVLYHCFCSCDANWWIRVLEGKLPLAIDWTLRVCG